MTMTWDLLVAQLSHQTWALLAVALAAAWLLSLLVIALGRGKQKTPPSKPNTKTHLASVQAEAMAASFQAQELIEFYQDTLETIRQQLDGLTHSLKDQAIEPVLENALDDTTQALAVANHQCQQLTQQLTDQHIESLNTQWAKIAQDPQTKSIDGAFADSEQQLAASQALRRALITATGGLNQCVQWHDQPASVRHQQALKSTEAIGQSVRSLSNSIDQSMAAIGQIQQALNGIQAHEDKSQ